MDAYELMSLHLCLCLRSVHCYKTHGQLWLHFTRGISGSVDARGSEICHCAVTADSYLYEKSNIRLFIALNKPPEADTAKTDPAIPATVFSVNICWADKLFESEMCVCVSDTKL